MGREGKRDDRRCTLSLLRRTQEEVAEQIKRESPSVTTGIPVHTADVLEKALSMPYYLSIYGLAPLDVSRMQTTQAIKHGVSVMLRSPVQSRDPLVIVNPKNVLISSSTGKLWSIPVHTDSNQEMAALAPNVEMIHTGDVLSTPTIIGLYTPAAGKDDTNQNTAPSVVISEDGSTISERTPDPMEGTSFMNTPTTTGTTAISPEREAGMFGLPVGPSAVPLWWAGTVPESPAALEAPVTPEVPGG